MPVSNLNCHKEYSIAKLKITPKKRFAGHGASICSTSTQLMSFQALVTATSLCTLCLSLCRGQCQETRTHLWSVSNSAAYQAGFLQRLILRRRRSCLLADCHQDGLECHNHFVCIQSQLFHLDQKLFSLHIPSCRYRCGASLVGYCILSHNHLSTLIWCRSVSRWTTNAKAGYLEDSFFVTPLPSPLTSIGLGSMTAIGWRSRFSS